MKIEEINDEGWAIPLKQALAESGGLHKKLRFKVLLTRNAFDSHLRQISAYFLQEIELSIPEVEEFAPFWLRLVPPKQLTKKFKMGGQVMYIDLQQGSTQQLSMHVHHAKNCYHTTIKKIDSEIFIFLFLTIFFISKLAFLG